MEPGARRRALHAAALLAGVAPLAWLGVRAATSGLGANPIETITHVTGDNALRFLLATLAVTPLRRLRPLRWIAPVRRTLGLVAFGWACLHLATWVVLDQFFDVHAMFEDVLDRRFITAGMAAFACMVPLAATSTRAAARRLGPRWKTLHRLVYVSATLAVVHFTWLVKADLAEPLLYGSVLAGLLGWRLARAARRAV